MTDDDLPPIDRSRLDRFVWKPGDIVRVPNAAYRYTSGRMLHYQDCMHFETDMPARLATDEEMVTLPVCATCAGAAPSSGRPGDFRCPECGMTRAVSMKAADGRCRDCSE